MLQNMKIKKSLILGFAITIAVSLAIIFATLTMMNLQRGAYHEILDYNVRANELVASCRVNANIAARNVRDMALRPTDSGNAALQKRAEEVLDTMNKDFEELKKVYPLTDKQILNDYINAVKEWEAVLPSIFNAINAGRGDDAVRLIKAECTPRLEAMASMAIQIDDALTNAQHSAVTQQSRNNIIMVVVIIAVMVIATIGVITMALKLIHSIVAPTEEVRNALVGFSEGNFDIEVEFESKNELGDMCEALRTSQRVLRALVDDECYLLEEMAQGNFDIKSKDRSIYVGGLKPVLESIRTINSNLSDTLAQIDLSAEQVSAGSEQVSTGAQALAQGATEQASAVEELSATISEISSKAQKNAENSQSAMEYSRVAGDRVDESAKYMEEMVCAMQDISDASQEIGKIISTIENIAFQTNILAAGDRVDESAKYMEEMVCAMQDISDASQEIGKIISTIENIAFQTNILALNAAVEAARAGSAGKGFAVVADEVRNLATKSDEAAKATKELIDRSISSVQNGNNIVKQVSESLGRTVEAAEHTLGLIQEISSAAEEEAEAIAQVTEGIDQISAVVQTNSATSEESAAASEELSSQAALMKDLMAKFKLRTMDDRYTAGSSAAAASREIPGEAGDTSGFASAFSKY